MSLADFERRMLRLKGVKLPSSELKPTNHNRYGRKAIVTQNNNVGRILTDIDEDYIRDEILDDIVQGIVRSFGTADSHKGYKLNVATIRSMLHKLPIISQLSIMDNYGYGRQQASKYAQACRLVIQFKQRHVVKCAFHSLNRYAE